MNISPIAGMVPIAALFIQIIVMVAVMIIPIVLVSIAKSLKIIARDRVAREATLSEESHPL